MMPKIYGSISGQSKQIKRLYGPVNGQTKEIKKLYGSVNGQTKLIYQKDTSMGTVEYYTDNTHTTTAIGKIQNQTELNSLSGNTSSYSVTVGGVAIQQSNLKEITLNSNVSSIPSNFLYYCEYIEKIDISQSSIIAIPDNFMTNAFQATPSLVISAFPSTLRTIGRNFLFMNFRVDQDFLLPATLVSIGKAFMSECRGMVGTITCNCPAAIVEPDGTGAYFETLAMGAVSPAYTTGISLTGTYANDWHTTFPDKSSGIYRKTIVV